jgi:dTDP-glucose 4,6-dehydratase
MPNLRNVLVTGGAGFIGSNFVHHLLGEDPDVRVVNLDALTYAGSRENLRSLPTPERHTFVQGNIGDRETVEGILRDEEIDTIVHFAAESHVDRSIHGPAPFIETNAVGTYTLLEAAREVWLGTASNDSDTLRFLHVSTDEVYGSLEPDDPAFSERSPYRPNSPYAASKAASDHLVRAYAHTYGLPVLITNCSNNYGPRQMPEKLIPLVISNALNGEALPIYGDGQQTRDWLYVEDHCRALLTVLRQGELGETYHIGGDNQTSNLELVRQVCSILDELATDSPHAPHDRLIQLVEDRPGHDRRYAMDIRKIGDQLGWRPREDRQSGLRKTVRWYLENPNWLAAIRGQRSHQEWMDRNYAERGATP